MFGGEVAAGEVGGEHGAGGCWLGCGWCGGFLEQCGVDEGDVAGSHGGGLVGEGDVFAGGEVVGGVDNKIDIRRRRGQLVGAVFAGGPAAHVSAYGIAEQQTLAGGDFLAVFRQQFVDGHGGQNGVFKNAVLSFVEHLSAVMQQGGAERYAVSGVVDRNSAHVQQVQREAKHFARVAHQSATSQTFGGVVFARGARRRCPEGGGRFLQSALGEFTEGVVGDSFYQVGECVCHCFMGFVWG